jgi:hypothetical protein
VAKAEEEIDGASALAGAKAKNHFHMLNPLIVLTSPQPELAAHKPPTSIAGV